ncbi:PEP-CTERM sorting domain-containing protein [Massilia sp. PAMC28688]|uniref:PEP-CTERM sorting domain-containing protein n=1 Tax=Massilia sp. PAMC28688 TaxID=2861283 RepID=UPI001C62ABA9|nr:PEP-CTERM sorting domain-containing protein [Massilia sp. PAMC28688]QYF93592.1 PEP-CTERM sorting domain-containing protein [Massilia sp. PAMC28688]
MTVKQLLVSVLGAMAFAGSANAALLSSTTTGAGNVVTDYSTGSQVSFDLDLAQLSHTSLTYTVEAADLANPYLSFNALVRNLSGSALHGFALYLDGIAFGPANGSVTPAFGSVGTVTRTDGKLAITFSAPEYAELHIGNPVLEADKFDWQLATAGLAVGDRFVITSAVPEPGNLTLMLAGMGACAMLRRRRK